MKNIQALHERFTQDPVSVRLGGIAANFSRIASFAFSPKNSRAVESMIEESKYFIEWTATETSPDVQAFLVELQVKLALLQLRWPEISKDISATKEIAQEADKWSNSLLRFSGILS